MGYRTVVMLDNDFAHEWGNDPELGKKIAHAMNSSPAQDRSVGNYGSVVECVHADVQTLAILDGYTFFDRVSVKSWSRNESDQERNLKLLKEFAESMGYRLTKIPTKG